MNKKVEELVEERITSKVNKEGFEIEYVEFVKEGDNNILRIVLDKPSGSVDVDECEKISRLVEDDVDGVISKEYVLEVSSPGLERNIKNLKLYNKYIGHEIYVKLFKKNEKYGKEITGILKKVDDGTIFIECDGDIAKLNVADVANAHTVYDFSECFKQKDNVNLNKLNKFNKK